MSSLFHILIRMARKHLNMQHDSDAQLLCKISSWDATSIKSNYVWLQNGGGKVK